MRRRRATFAVMVAAAVLGSGCRGSSAPAPMPPRLDEPARGVGIRTEVFVDPTRRTDDPTSGLDPLAARAARPTRTLRTQIHYPASGGGGPGAVEGAPARSGGPFPLVIFAHGHTVPDPAAAYGALLRGWAAAGYVVAAPTFPMSSTSLPGSNLDLENQPADVTFVLSQLLGLSAAGGPYAGLIAADRVAIAGHSLGGMTALGATANTCCTDERFRAAVVLAATERPFPGGTFFRGHSVPTMVVHGDRDAVIPFEAGRMTFDRAPPPKVMLELPGGDHGTPYGGDADAQARLVATTTLAFLDHYVGGRPDGLDRIRAATAGHAPGRIEVVDR